MSRNYLSRLVEGWRTGATRRQLLQGSGVLAAGWMLPARTGAQGPPSGLAAQPAGSIYATVGARPLINARGTVTIVGATRVLPEVKAAMDRASREYVQLDDLMAGVSRRLAELTGAEWGIVTSGASAALSVATAACIVGGDPDKLARIPDLRGLKDEIIMPRYSRTAYDHAVKAVGARVVEVDSPDALQKAFGPRTAMIMVLAGSSSRSGPLSLPVLVPLARQHGVPILVDAAADELRGPEPIPVRGRRPGRL